MPTEQDWHGLGICIVTNYSLGPISNEAAGKCFPKMERPGFGKLLCNMMLMLIKMIFIHHFHPR
jgi:hypothetical protein